MKHRINFNEEHLKEALAKHFKIKSNQITFWYISSLTKKDFIIEYEDKT
jgi:hypothetical protein